MASSSLMCIPHISRLSNKLLLPRSSVANAITHFRKQQNVKPRSWHSLFRPEEVEAYRALYPKMMETIIKPVLSEIPEVTEKLKMVMGRMLPNDKIIEGMKVTTLYKMLDPPEKQTQEKMFVTGVLGWCLDLMTCAFIVFDDFIDHDETRFDKPCLHKYEDVKLEALNYGLIFQYAPYYLLKEFCSQFPWYNPCMELFHSAALHSSFGQSLEEMSRAYGKPIFERYTKENAFLISEYKAKQGTALIPLMLAMFASGNYDLSFPTIADEVLGELGVFITVQDAMTDYEIPKINQSLACDISQGKCTWLVIQALEKGSIAQKELIYKHYGQKNMKSVNIINKLYEDIAIFDLYKDYKQKSYNFVMEKTPTLLIKEDHRRLLYNYAELIYEMSPN